MKPILASASPRRKLLLELLVPEFDVVVSEVSEKMRPGTPAEALTTIAAAKLSAVAQHHPGRPIIAADTGVVMAGQILGQPNDATEARAMLRRINQTSHEVITGLCISDGRGRPTQRAIATKVRLSLPLQVLDEYVASGAWKGKAGAYGLQDAAIAPYATVDGSWSNVVGFPVDEVRQTMGELGLECLDEPTDAQLKLQNPF